MGKGKGEWGQEWEHKKQEMQPYKTKLWFYTRLVLNTKVKLFRGLQLPGNTGMVRLTQVHRHRNEFIHPLLSRKFVWLTAQVQFCVRHSPSSGTANVAKRDQPRVSVPGTSPRANAPQAGTVFWNTQAKNDSSTFRYVCAALKDACISNSLHKDI